MIDRHRRREQGFALTVTLLLSVLLVMLGLSAVMVSTTELRIAANHKSAVQAFYVAEAGAQKATGDLGALLSAGEIPSTSQLAQMSQDPPEFDDYVYTDYSVSKDGSPQLTPILTGPYWGLAALIQTYSIVSEVRGPSGVRKRVEQSIDHLLLPIFQFGVFYDGDLEILPGPAMILQGRVHTNTNLYTATWDILSYDSKVTAAGHIFHRRKDSSELPSGTVRFKDADDQYRSMSFDSTAPDWLELSVETWGGQVEDDAHGIGKLNLPIPYDVEFIDLIERGDAADPAELRDVMYYWKADLKIIDGTATDSEGDPVPLEPGIVSTETFYNFREGKWLTATQVDIDSLIAYGRDPTNGILYISMSETVPTADDAVVRLAGGTGLPAQGLTVATDNPLYVWGDYNTVEPKPASLVCDAINILSNNWEDANSDQPLVARIATDTEVNAAIMAGTTESSWGQYNGGLENLPRFLEDWGGEAFTYRGSLVCVWQSVHATGPWYYGGNYYTAPVRDWSFDQGFLDPADLPPGTPYVHSFQRHSWHSR
jgi:hypothetical protein